MDHERFWMLLSRKFAGEATPTDIKELDRLLEQDPECRARHEALSRYWNQKNQHPTANADLVFQKTLSKIRAQAEAGEAAPAAGGREGSISGEARQFPLLPWLLRVAAVVVLSGAGFLCYQGLRQDTLARLFLEEKQNALGVQSRITLSDGSTVWLNGDSKLQFPADFTGQSREVYLTGEAFFEVAPDTRKPFIIHLPNSKIKVLGTSFNVRAFAGDDVVETSVATGKVAFIPRKTFFDGAGKDTLLLTPDLKVVYSGKTGQVRQERTDSQADKAWTEGRLVFRATRLEEVGKALERTYGKRILFADPYLKQCRLTATFQNSSLEEVLYLLSRTRGHRYTISDREVVIEGPGCQAN